MVTHTTTLTKRRTRGETTERGDAEAQKEGMDGEGRKGTRSFNERTHREQRYEGAKVTFGSTPFFFLAIRCPRLSIFRTLVHFSAFPLKLL